MTMKAPVGPPICTLLPPSNEMRKPATMAVMIPFSGLRNWCYQGTWWPKHQLYGNFRCASYRIWTNGVLVCSGWYVLHCWPCQRRTGKEPSNPCHQSYYDGYRHFGFQLPTNHVRLYCNLLPVHTHNVGTHLCIAQDQAHQHHQSKGIVLPHGH